MSKIIILSSDDLFIKTLKYDLKVFNHQIEIAIENNILDFIMKDHFDLIIINLDIQMDNVTDLISRIKMTSNKTKVIVFSDVYNELEEVSVLNSGANDYLLKSISAQTMLARINVQLRECNVFDSTKEIINEKITIDYNKMEVYLNNDLISLTKLEYDLFRYFSKNRNKVISRKKIMDDIWKYEYDPKNRVIDIYVNSLKKKLDLFNELKSKRGVGYIFVVDK